MPVDPENEKQIKYLAETLEQTVRGITSLSASASILQTYYNLNQTSGTLADAALSSYIYDAISLNPHAKKAVDIYKSYVCSELGLKKGVEASEESLLELKKFIASLSVTNDFDEAVEHMFVRLIVEGGFACFVNALPPTGVSVSELLLSDIKPTLGTDGSVHLTCSKIPLADISKQVGVELQGVEQLPQFVCVGLDQKATDYSFTPLFSGALQALITNTQLQYGLNLLTVRKSYQDSLHITVKANTITGVSSGNDANSQVSQLHESLGKPENKTFYDTVESAPVKQLPHTPNTFITPDNVTINQYNTLSNHAALTTINEMVLLDLVNGLGVPPPQLGLQLSSTETQMEHFMRTFMAKEAYLRKRMSEIVSKLVKAYNLIAGSDVLPTEVEFRPTPEAMQYREGGELGERLKNYEMEAVVIANMKSLKDIGEPLPEKYYAELGLTQSVSTSVDDAI